MKGSKVLLFLLIILFLAYTVIYISYENGYYETRASKKVNLTNEKIMEFENDVASGKQVDLKDYLDGTEIDYSNNVSDMTLKVSKAIEKSFNKVMKKTFKYISKLIEE